MSESQLQFLKEFADKWSKEERDKYTKEVLRWIADILIIIAKTRNPFKIKGILERVAKENKEKIERIPIIFIYAVKPEFRDEVARILRIINGIVRKYGLV